MRSGLLISTLVLSLALAGCGGSSDDSSSSTTTGQCLSTEDDGSPACTTTSTSTTSLAPNVPPILVYAISVGTVATNVTTLGENVTVEATGSSDPDGDGLSVIAVGAQDSNQTYAPQFLYFNGEFTKATFKFNQPGKVNITITAADMRNDVTIVHTNVFVNEKVTVSNAAAMRLVVPSQAQAPQPTTCKGPSGQSQASALDAEMSSQATFRVLAGTQFVHAKVTAGTANIAICAPGATAISGAGTEVTSTKGTVFTPPAGTALYYIEIYSGAANQAAGAVTIDVTVHYEAQV